VRVKRPEESMKAAETGERQAMDSKRFRTIPIYRGTGQAIDYSRKRRSLGRAIVRRSNHSRWITIHRSQGYSEVVASNGRCDAIFLAALGPQLSVSMLRPFFASFAAGDEPNLRPISFPRFNVRSQIYSCAGQVSAGSILREPKSDRGWEYRR
jgi:hypothetical protein